MAGVHEEAAIADARQATALDRADVHRHALANGAAAADFQPCRLALVAQILRRTAKRSKGRDGAAGADRGVAADGDMRGQGAVRADHGMGADGAIGPDRGAVADHGAVLYPRGRIDLLHVNQSVSIAPTSASATTLPFT